MNARLVDTFHRIHDNLRVSVTDRCNIRCRFCMPERDVVFTARENILSFEEIQRFVSILSPLGVRKVRITGGEPLVRKDLPKLMRKLASVPGIEDIGLTTNAVLLAEQAQPLYEAGLRRLNIHLDTLDRKKFFQLTRRDELPRVLEGIHAAKRAGFRSIKLNAVALRGFSEEDIVPLACFALDHGLQVRFIEFMPLDADGLWTRDQVLLADDILEILGRHFGRLEPVPDQDPRAPALEYRLDGGAGRVGFIASISRPFCLNCNRIRLTADGKLRYCLFAIEETDIRTLLRHGASDGEIAEAVRRTVKAKWLGHEINNAAKFIPPPRPMYAIGG